MEKRAERIEQTAEIRGCGSAFASVRGAVPLFQASLILLQLTIQGAIGPVEEPLVSTDGPKGTRGRIVPIGGAALWLDTGPLPRRTEKGFGGREVARFAASHVNQIARLIDRSGERLPVPWTVMDVSSTDQLFSTAPARFLRRGGLSSGVNVMS